MWALLKYLQAADELLQDKMDLREFGLTEEELEGYEDFFINEYFPKHETV